VIGAGGDDAGETLASIESTETSLYNQIRAGLARIWVELPPAAAVAGVYAQVDATRGVWKAPANVSVASVISPTTKISDAEQESLNVDPTAGKSINAIRSFTGRGTLVWGARTLAGNDNEWRYVPVRRLFNMIEESASKSTGFAVFEPNDATTWLKVKGMLESFLFNLWERGALAGPTPEAAYFVDIGLGKTMTADDVLNGRMIVRVGVAAVRPAEFIVLEFTHKLQEA
jgi:phage tail sheath protein FI